MRTVLAVDGGNSKTDVALVAEDGRLVAAVRGPTTSHQAVGLVTGMERLAGMVAEVVAASEGRDRPSLGSYTLAGADTPPDGFPRKKKFKALRQPTKSTRARCWAKFDY